MDKVLGMDSELLSANVAAKEVLIPTLVVHDKQDEDVPVSCAHNIRQSLKNGELLITDGLGHRRILIDTKVIDQIIHFLEK
jgi:pimeloyl-ACP methyl ester carboxylesterase